MAGKPKYHRDLVVLDQTGIDAVTELLEQGKTLASVCYKLGVGKRALSAWLDAPDRAALVSRARAKAADHLVAQVLEIADEVPEDNNAINKARLRVDTRKWVAAKWNPQAYADNKNAQVVVNIGDLHLKAVKHLATITIPSTTDDSNVIDAEAHEVEPAEVSQ